MSRSTGPDEATRDEVYARAGWRCERCGADGPVLAIHHRRPRRMGGSRDPLTNDLSNLALLCDYGDQACHPWVETHRAEALAEGWLLHANDDPRDHPPEGLTA